MHKAAPSHLLHKRYESKKDESKRTFVQAESCCNLKEGGGIVCYGRKILQGLT